MISDRKSEALARFERDANAFYDRLVAASAGVLDNPAPPRLREASGYDAFLRAIDAALFELEVPRVSATHVYNATMARAEMIVESGVPGAYRPYWIAHVMRPLRDAASSGGCKSRFRDTRRPPRPPRNGAMEAAMREATG